MTTPSGTPHAAGTPGALMWTASYNGVGNPFSAYDWPCCVAASPNGKLTFVTGVTTTKYSKDYLTIAYSRHRGPAAGYSERVPPGYVHIVGAVPGHRRAVMRASDRRMPTRYAAGFVLLAVMVAFVPRLRRPGGELPTWRLVAWLVLLFIFVCLVAFIWKGG